MTRFISKRGAFKDLAIGVEFSSAGDKLTAVISFSATLGTKRKNARVEIDLDNSLHQFAGTLPAPGEPKHQAPVAIIPQPTCSVCYSAANKHTCLEPDCPFRKERDDR